MQDDFYQISADGWKAEPEWEAQGKKKRLTWYCNLLPKEYITGRYFSKEEAEILKLDEKHTAAVQEMDSLIEENSGEDGIFSELDAVKKAPVKALLKELKSDKERKEEAAVLSKWLALEEGISKLKKQLKEAEADLDKKAVAKYPELTEDEVKDILVNDKWLPVLDWGLAEELGRAVNSMEERILVLADRYAKPMAELSHEVEELSSRVAEHLKRMGLAWN